MSSFDWLDNISYFCWYLGIISEILDDRGRKQKEGEFSMAQGQGNDEEVSLKTLLPPDTDVVL